MEIANGEEKTKSKKKKHERKADRERTLVTKTLLLKQLQKF